MGDGWRVLVVDDAPDIHTVTGMALRRKTWRGRGFQLISANSAAEARKILTAPDAPLFHVALVDVVMETDTAGLDLCRFIRDNVPLSTRIILRTGQPGVAPEEIVLNDYDIDQYLSKPEATSERLYSAVRASLRGSLDVALLQAVGEQLRKYMAVLQQPSASLSAMLAVMQEGLKVLGERHGVGIMFVADATKPTSAAPARSDEDPLGAGDAAIATALLEVHAAPAGTAPPFPGEARGLPANSLLVPVRALERKAAAAPEAARSGGALSRLVKSLTAAPPQADTPPMRGGFYVESRVGALTEKATRDLLRELLLFGENWKVAIALLLLQDVFVNDRIAADDAATRYGAF